MALMLVLAGTATALTALVAMTLRSVRDVESSVPDHDAAVAATVVTS
jgi:hypothetical protein